MTACKFKNALQLAFLLVALSFGATAQAALVGYYIFLYNSSGVQTGAGTFKIDDSQLSTDGLKPVQNLEVSLPNTLPTPPTLFNAQCSATWQAYVNTATVTKVRHLANSPVRYSCRGGTTLTLTGIPETGDTTGRYFQYTVTGTGDHTGETGKYVIKVVNVAVPEPGSAALLLAGVAALAAANLLSIRRRRAWKTQSTSGNKE